MLKSLPVDVHFEVIVTNLDNHRGTVVFRGIPRSNEENFATTAHTMINMPSEVEVIKLEKPGDWAIIKTGDVLVRAHLHHIMTDADHMSLAIRV